MAKPFVCYQAKRLVDAALESNWDFELTHGPATMFLQLTDGLDRISATWQKTPTLDTMGRNSTSYRKIELTAHNGNRVSSVNLDTAERLIQTGTIRKTYNPRKREPKPEPQETTLF